MSDLLDQYGFLVYSKGNLYSQNEEYTIARIISQHRQWYEIVTEKNIMFSRVSGKFAYKQKLESGYPVVGDYVLVSLSQHDDMAIIEKLLPRRTLFYRKDNWSKDGIQVLASNFQTIFICTSLDSNFNPARIERYMILAKESGANISIVLTKSDLCDDIESEILLCQQRFPDVAIHAISVHSGEGLDELNLYFEKGKTALFLGSSGVGKSSLANALIGRDTMQVGETRKDGKGKHTTVHRQIIKLPNGGLLIDTPGLREVGIVCATEGISDVFGDIEALESLCKYRDCKHQNERGCAVRAAIENGELDIERYQNYVKYKMENLLVTDKVQYLLAKWKRSKEKSVNLRKTRNFLKKK
ncbi:tigr00157: ribosome small subunit-dependent gtpase a [Lucifera butyrica]|uniref:Small ribosomal subunit biogenesis GTPase RsgA n=1 Tax=Lucifera butyrica TaxID=1351585 RepID=A0A498R8C4_9FIRM|nr:ribosome small subunit-dependent GTPase A [Lucifera butyrica]VBB07180.1 tigr00157: ribosome small subunit-dependent gtpase a [Lucifera butyrica]